MLELERLAEEESAPVQTHLSENTAECDWVKQLEPDCDHYTQVYHR